ncbi:hypothetical protein PoMZ_12841 [Pyricularia oryzae]|uniref:Uncharacterized protein n=1 Tax=Pyricularia oryzae TaxID=318829 RepID=A0A4P7NTL8_PYROR|nr:hypothetical protein PoMZ_12841 [Pyricularia oryzae]
MACKGIRIGPRYGSKGSYLTQAWVGRCRSPEWLMLRRGRCCVASKGKSPIGITGSHRMYCVVCSTSYDTLDTYTRAVTGTIQQFETHKPSRHRLGSSMLPGAGCNLRSHSMQPPESPISGNFGAADLVRAAGPALAQPLEGGTTF